MVRRMIIDRKFQCQLNKVEQAILEQGSNKYKQKGKKHKHKFVSIEGESAPRFADNPFTALAKAQIKKRLRVARKELRLKAWSKNQSEYSALVKEIGFLKEALIFEQQVRTESYITKRHWEMS